MPPHLPATLRRTARSHRQRLRRRRLLAALATAGLGAGLLAACGGPSSASPPSSTSASSAALAAKVPTAPSAGCGVPATSRPPGTTTVPFTADGLAGDYLQHVPAGFGGRPLPLVVDLHGYSETAAIQAQVSQWAAFGDRHGLVAVTPEITRTVPLWNTALGSPDLSWFGSLLTAVEADECVDLHRVYVDGYSDGAFMTSAVACQFAARVAAVAPVAGIQAVGGCRPSRPVPVIAFHGTADPFVSYDGGLGPKALDLPAPNGHGTLGQAGAAASSVAGKGPSAASIPHQAAAWARRNGCGATASSVPVADRVTLISYPCPPDASVELYRVTGGGHAWPGSAFSRSIASFVGYTTFAISADDLMWAFFLAHPLGLPSPG